MPTDETPNDTSVRTRLTGLLLGLFLFCVFAFLRPVSGLSYEAQVVLATALLMASWWLTEAISIYATSLVPLVAFPVLGILPTEEVAPNYMDPNIVLFMGGFFLAMAIQKWNLHRRIALTIVSLIGTHPRRLVLGFMLATAFLSMWVSNTATTIMIFPIGLAVILHLEEQGLREKSNLPIVLLLGIAFAANIGGTATLIGTPPNLVFAAQFSELFPNKTSITFSRWFLLGFPLALVFLCVCWLYLTRIYRSLGLDLDFHAQDVVQEELQEMGAMSAGEKGVSLVFVLAAFGWMFRQPIQIQALTIPGWSSLFPVPGSIHDATVATIVSLLLFVTPVDLEEGTFLLDWDWAVQIPWGVLLLFGGGIALADGFQTSGLSAWVGRSLNLLYGTPILLLVLCICFMMTFLTEVTSNTATSTIFMPILASAASALSVPPAVLMVPATLSASCAFMLPVATPPNAIVFGSDRLSIPDMAGAGIWMNLIGIVLVTLANYILLGVAFGVSY